MKIYFSNNRKDNENKSRLEIVRNISDNTIGKLYTSHFSELLFIAYHLLGNEEEAEDAVSGIFEKLITMEFYSRWVKPCNFGKLLRYTVNSKRKLLK